MKNGIELISDERKRQIEEEGYSLNDDKLLLGDGELTCAAIAYAMETVNSTMAKNYFPWDKKFFKPKDKLRNLVRAGALIAAEIDKLQNQNNKEKEEFTDSNIEYASEKALIKELEDRGYKVEEETK